MILFLINPCRKDTPLSFVLSFVPLFSSIGTRFFHVCLSRDCCEKGLQCIATQTYLLLHTKKAFLLNMGHTEDERKNSRIVIPVMLAIASSVLLMTPTTFSALLPNAEAAMLAQDVVTYTLKGQVTTVNLAGSANYPTFHYIISAQPQNGKIVTLDAKAGQLTYQPNTSFAGVDSFNYKIVSNNNETWTSNTGIVKVAVVEPWKQYCNNNPITPLQLTQYVKDRHLTAANMPGIIGTTNIEPMKATPLGNMEYVNAKIAFELANGSYSWWMLDLGQKAWMMDNYCNLLDRTDLWLNPQR
jgi:hypothetical protein